jgi:hypothetical protein
LLDVNLLTKLVQLGPSLEALIRVVTVQVTVQKETTHSM